MLKPRSEMKICVGLIVLFIFKPKISLAKEDSEKKEEIEGIQICSEAFCLPIDYNKLQAPFKELEPLDIAVQIGGIECLEIDDVRSTVNLIMTLFVVWNDLRITVPSEHPASWVTLDSKFAESLWLPDIYIYDMKEIVVPKFNIKYTGTIFNYQHFL